MKSSFGEKGKWLVFVMALFFCIVGFAFENVGVERASALRSEFAGGNGTAESPYEIATTEHFKNIIYHRDSCFIQTANLNFSGVSAGNIGSINEPFTGVYDGDKYYISNLLLDSDSDNAGLFSHLGGGMVKNVQLIDCVITGQNKIGGIVGVNNGTVYGCAVTAEIGATSFAGGIVGVNNGEISNCAFHGNAQAKYYAGGIVGVNFGKVVNSYNDGSVSSEIYAGGIAGLNNGQGQTAVLEQIYSVGKVSGNARGNLIGDNQDGFLRFGRWNSDSSMKGDSAFNFYPERTQSSYALDQADIASGYGFGDWNGFWDHWMLLTNRDHPILKAEYVEVKEVRFHEDEVSLYPGDEYTLQTEVLPEHAAQKFVEYEITENSEYCVLDKNTDLITVDPNAPIGTVIRVVAKAEQAIAVQNIKVVKIPATSLNVFSKNGNNTVVVGGVCEVETEVYPCNASYPEVRYEASVSYVDISYDGIVRVADNAPVGQIFTVKAILYDDSKIYGETAFTTVDATVTDVLIENSTLAFKETESLVLSGRAEFINGTSTSEDVEFDIISYTMQNAYLVGNVVMASGVGTVTVTARYKGIQSEQVILQVLPEPVTSVEFIGKNTVSVGENLYLFVKALPDNATFAKDIAYDVTDDGGTGVTLTENVLSANSVGTVVVRITVGGYSIEQTVYVEEYTSDKFIAPQDIEYLGSTEFKITQSLPLIAQAIPSNASIRNVVYEIAEDNGTGACIRNGELTAQNIGQIKLLLKVGEITKSVEITARKEPVTKIEFITKYAAVKTNGSVVLDVVVTPHNATAKSSEAVYEIVETSSIEAAIVGGNRLKANREGSVRVRATLDGVSCEKLFEIIEEPVTSIVWTGISESMTSGDSLPLSAVAYPLDATYREITVSMEEFSCDSAEIENGILTAYGEGTVTLSIRTKNFSVLKTIRIYKNPVTGVAIAEEAVVSQREGETVFRTSNDLVITPSVDPYDATYQDIAVAYRYDSGVANAAFRVEAVADGCFNGSLTEELLLKYGYQKSGELYQDLQSVYPSDIFEIDGHYNLLFLRAGDSVRLNAEFDGTFTLRFISLDNHFASCKRVYAIEEEFVDEIWVTTRQTDPVDETQAERIRITENDFYYRELNVVRGNSLTVKSFVFAQDGRNRQDDETFNRIFPTYQSDLYLLKTEEYEDLLSRNILPVSKCEGKFVINDLGEYYLVAVSEHGINQTRIISAPMKINVIPNDIIDMNDEGRLRLSPNGEFDYDFSYPEGFIGYKLLIQRDGEVLYDGIMAPYNVYYNARLYLFHNYGTYDVEMGLAYKAYGNGTLVFPLDTSAYHGVQLLPHEQVTSTIDEQEAAFVMYDFSIGHELDFSKVNDFNGTVTLYQNVKVLYIYGYPTENYRNIVHRNINFEILAESQIQVILDGARFAASLSTVTHTQDALLIDSQEETFVTITYKRDCYLKGGDGVNGIDGISAFKSFRSKANSGYGGRSGDVVWVAGGEPNGEDGGKGDDGQHGAHGQDGTSGGNGGFGIRVGTHVNSDVVSGTNASLTLVGGNGGNGGNGSDGQDGQRGGNGGNGGNGALRWVIVANVAGGGGNGGDAGAGGNGGNAGAGGDAGAKGLAWNVAYQEKFDSMNIIKTEGQSDGTVGQAGKRGLGGNAGWAGSGGSGAMGMIFIFPYFGSDGKSGASKSKGADGLEASAGQIRQNDIQSILLHEKF